jgi:uncharacterized protein
MPRVTTADVPSLADTSARPRFTGGRIEALDVLRGVAVFGILLANVQVFSGFHLLSDFQRAALPFAALDRISQPLLHLLVDGKFYSIFSLLFGVGFAIQLQRAAASGEEFARRYRRRLAGLFAIGAAHALLIWMGDILMLYAIGGFCLLAFRERDERRLLRLAVVFAIIPLIQYGVMLGAYLMLVSPGTGEGSTDANPMAFVISAFATGSYPEVFRVNLVSLGFRWADLLFTGRLFKVLAIFLLGFWVVRRGLLMDTPENRAFIARVARWGLGIGLPLNAAMVLVGTDPYYSLQPAGALYAVLHSVGVPVLALGYAALVVTLWRRRPGGGWLAVFAPVGRMALTNYLMHSVVAVLFFYGYGLGFYGRVGATTGLGLAAILLLAQVPLSHWWMRHFRHGPAEWLWRRLTLAQPLPFRRAR